MDHDLGLVATTTRANATDQADTTSANPTADPTVQVGASSPNPTAEEAEEMRRKEDWSAEVAGEDLSVEENFVNFRRGATSNAIKDLARRLATSDDVGLDEICCMHMP